MTAPARIPVFPEFPPPGIPESPRDRRRPAGIAESLPPASRNPAIPAARNPGIARAPRRPSRGAMRDARAPGGRPAIPGIAAPGVP